MNFDIKDLTIKEKIGQMMMVGIDNTYITERTKKLILDHKIGGVILYRKNFNTYQDMIKLIKDLKELNKQNRIPLFIAIDQEGGRVNRMPKEILNLPAANKIAQRGGLKLVEESANIIGELLKNSGFNMNFAPVLDIKRFDENQAIGDRSFSDNKDDVIKYGITTMKQLQEKNIISVIKHFPGHGATKRDSHYMLPVIRKSINQLYKEDMKVFEEAIKQNADAILIGHLLIKQVTGIYPASLSRKFIVRYLRKKYRYNGLIISDDLKMKSIKFLYGADLAVKKAFQAGNDIIVFRYNKNEEEKAINKIVKLAEKNKLKQYRIDRSVKRIISIKEKYNISDYTDIKGIDLEEINNRISVIREEIL